MCIYIYVRVCVCVCVCVCVVRTVVDRQDPGIRNIAQLEIGLFLGHRHEGKTGGKLLVYHACITEGKVQLLWLRS